MRTKEVKNFRILEVCIIASVAIFLHLAKAWQALFLVNLVPPLFPHTPVGQGTMEMTPYI
ncbi:MAG: hypothetical protein B2I17_04380 [Thermoplasmatales archaeon B_DKE]|nr:MAG: hypothetical protein B2I17_04380 [Thermoplasmatales archaeon B_DKE]